MLPKPGYRTTEFWAMVAVVVGNLAAALAGELPPRYASLASAISAAGYALARGLAKRPPHVP